MDQIGNIIAFTGRVLDSKDSPKYLNIAATPLYDKSKALYGINFVKKNITEYEKIIVVEGNMDVIALHRIGLPIGVATCGTSLTHEHIKIIKRHTDTVYFCFDNDDAGFSATVRGMKLAYEQDLFPQVIELSQLVSDYGVCKDIDDFANAGGNAKDLLAKSIDGLEYIMKHLGTTYNLNNPVEKKKCIDTVFEIIKSIQDLSITQHYLSKVSELRNIAEGTLLGQYKNRYKKGRFIQQRTITKESNTYTLDTDSLIYSLFHESLYHRYCSGEKIREALNFYKQIHIISFPDHKTSGEDSYELWRTQELGVMESSKQEQYIIHTITKRIDELLKHILKLSSISPEQKSQFMETRKRLRI